VKIRKHQQKQTRLRCDRLQAKKSFQRINHIKKGGIKAPRKTHEHWKVAGGKKRKIWKKRQMVMPPKNRPVVKKASASRKTDQKNWGKARPRWILWDAPQRPGPFNQIGGVPSRALRNHFLKLVRKHSVFTDTCPLGRELEKDEKQHASRSVAVSVASGVPYHLKRGKDQRGLIMGGGVPELQEAPKVEQNSKGAACQKPGGQVSPVKPLKGACRTLPRGRERRVVAVEGRESSVEGINYKKKLRSRHNRATILKRGSASRRRAQYSGVLLPGGGAMEKKATAEEREGKPVGRTA